MSTIIGDIFKMILIIMTNMKHRDTDLPKAIMDFVKVNHKLDHV